jgi:hypothetical protein
MWRISSKAKENGSTDNYSIGLTASRGGAVGIATAYRLHNGGVGVESL